MNYLLIILKLIIGFASMLILFGLFGYRNLSPSTGTDQIYNYVLGGMIGGAIYNENISLLQFIIVMTIWGLLIKLLDLIKTRYNRIRILIDGESLVLYEKEDFNRKNLKKANISVQDFYNKIRINGIYSINELRYAEMGKDGNILLIRKDDSELGYLIIYDGKINPLEFNKADLELEDLNKEINRRNINSISNIYSCEYLMGNYIIKLYN